MERSGGNETMCNGNHAWCLSNPRSSVRTLREPERRLAEKVLQTNLTRLWTSSVFCCCELLLVVASLVGIQSGIAHASSALALAIMPGMLGLVIGGFAIRPAQTMVAGLRKDLLENKVEVFGEEDVLRLPTSGLGLAIYGRPSELGIVLPLAASPPKNQSQSYPARLEWRPDRSRFVLCRQLSSAELDELGLLRARIASRHFWPAVGFLVFGSFAIFGLSEVRVLSDPMVPVSVLGAGAWFIWQLAHDLYVASRLSRENAVVSDLIREGAYELSVEVLPTASLVWTIDHAPAGWRF